MFGRGLFEKSNSDPIQWEYMESSCKQLTEYSILRVAMSDYMHVLFL